MAEKKETESTLERSLKTVQSLDVSLECFDRECKAVVFWCVIDTYVMFDVFKEEEY